MGRFGVVPREVRRGLDLERSERILAGAPDAAGRWVVATERALYVPDGRDSTEKPGGLAYDRIGWEQIDHATWERDEGVLRVTEAAAFGEPMPVRVLQLDYSERLLALVRERVTASVVIDRQVPLRGRRGVRVVARRRPAGDTELVWSVVFDEGIEPSDPEMRAAAEAVLAEIRAEIEVMP